MFNATLIIKLLAKKRLASLNKQDPVVQQEKIFKSILKKNNSTKFFKDHKLSASMLLKDYQKIVPLRNYDDFWQEYWKTTFPNINNITTAEPILYYAVSSGTSTGRTKYIPITKSILNANKKAGLDLLFFHLNNKKDSNILSGKIFFLGGSTNLTPLSNGICYGDLSGIATKELPRFLQYYYYPPKKIALLENWEKKIDTICNDLIKNKQKITAFCGVPSWMLIFLNEYSKKIGLNQPKIKNIFPNLELLTHGGVNFMPYKKQFDTLLEGLNADIREVYPASEGFIAIADKLFNQGLRLQCDNALFYEFIPFEELNSKQPARHWIKNIEPNINYAIALTTPAGLWSYILGDTVKFISLNPPRLLITGRVSYYLSPFGEHLTAEEIETAVSSASNAINASIKDYLVYPLYPNTPSELGRHIFLIEFNREITNKEKKEFLKILDNKLSELNEDYQAHRAEGFGLAMPQLQTIPDGGFKKWMKHKGKLGGQHKVPRIVLDQNLIKELEEFFNIKQT